MISSFCGVLVSGLLGRLGGHERPATAGFLRVESEVMVALNSAFDLHILVSYVRSSSADQHCAGGATASPRSSSGSWRATATTARRGGRAHRRLLGRRS
jgi:hypothetical protein